MSDTTRAGYNRRHRPPRLILLLIVLVLILANGIVALISVDELREADTRAARALQAIIALKAVENLAAGSGDDQRLYRLTADTRHLEAYRKAQAELRQQLQGLHRLVTEDPAHPDPVDRLSSLIEQDSQALAASLSPIKPTGETAPTSAEIAAGIQRSNAIVAAVDGMIESEETLLDKRFATMTSRNTVLSVTVAIGAVSSVVLIGITFAMMHLALKRSERLAATHSGALQESEQRFRRVFDESPLGILLAEPDTHRIVQANPAFCHMLGADAEQIIGRTIAELTHIDDRELLSDAIRRGAAPDHGIEARYVMRSGSIAWASVRFTQLSAFGHRPGLLLALTEDVTREKRVEAELRQAQKMEAIGQLTGGIAHDFNNLLGVIIGNVEFLIDTVHDPDQSDLAKEILGSALSGADLTRRLLAFARRQPLQPRRIDLNAYVPNHIAILRRLLGETIAITIDLADDLWPTRADPSQVGDVLLNLAINARDAMPHGGAISIATANAHLEAGDLDGRNAEGDFVVLSVTDTGTGMPPELLDRVVEPFFTTKEPGAGSGLGLSIIFGFAKQSGGFLQIDSEPGHGTTVRVYLPRALEPEACEGEDPADASDTALPHGNESILLVDDNAEMRKVTRRHLVALGYRVSEANSGPAALEILQAGNRFDLLLTDVVMPEGMTGYQLAAAARQRRPDLKVLFTTGYTRANPDGERLGPVAGAMIRKPYRRQDLAVTLRAALQD
jgi:PAS domain S-box-containing protein